MLKEHAKRIDHALANPSLSVLIWEATRNCNLKCPHCCIPKGDWDGAKELTTGQAKNIFLSVAQDFDPASVHIAITGGEATLRKDLVEMVGYLAGLKFAQVSVDSNGVNYVKDAGLIDRLFEAGMASPTIGIDGLRDGYRKTKGADLFDGIIKVIKYAVSKYPEKNLTTFTLVNNYNKDEIPELIDLLAGVGVRYARIGLLSPIGRTAGKTEKAYKLSPLCLGRLLRWIGKKREEYLRGKFPLEIELSEDGWCGIKYECMTKPDSHIFFCQTGLYAASILYDGKIAACPHLPRSLTVQGDALKQRFSDVWKDEFKLFRDRQWCKINRCARCPQWDYCRGGPMHYRDTAGTMKKCLYLDDIRPADKALIAKKRKAR
jgi:radical SAM protein with 4Fe4S-binding SPASM domain